MELIKHSLLTESIITERGNQLFKVHAENFLIMEQDSFTNIHTEAEPEALNGLLMRQFKYGILGRLDEGEMLIEDFYNMERFAALEALYMNYPFSAFSAFSGSEISIIGTIQLAAAARHEVNIANGIDMEYWYCLENDFTDVDGTIALNELAALADITLQSIRNEISLGKTQFKSLSGENGQYVSVEEAKEWLKKKSGFKPTLGDKDLREIEVRDNTVYVPVAKDGSFLSKDCKMTRGYQVGEKGSQQYFESLIEARNFLLTMQKARWRRPNANGGFGIVSAKEWRFINRDDVL
jgi:hypothetical protein